jgi:hypothetical protein
MDWGSPFVVYRITAEGKLEQVFQAEDLKKAKYWLTYIAKPGDVLCKTPAHPKHTGKTPAPEYWSHKAQSGTPCSKEDEWWQFAKSKSTELSFPTDPAQVEGVSEEIK